MANAVVFIVTNRIFGLRITHTVTICHVVAGFIVFAAVFVTVESATKSARAGLSLQARIAELEEELEAERASRTKVNIVCCCYRY